MDRAEPAGARWTAAALARNLGTIGIETDEKRIYPSLIREAFGAEHGIAHDTTKSTRIRDVSNRSSRSTRPRRWRAT
jgi:hypothetical protein